MRDINKFEQKPKETSENTVTRLKAIQEIYDRVKNGEDLDEVCLELAERENIKNVYMMYVKNGTEPINILLKNAYLARIKNEDRMSRINGAR